MPRIWLIERPIPASTDQPHRDTRGTVLERHVAVKIISPRLANDPSALQRFADEARITAQLDHPNIVPVHKLGHAPNETPCLAMKLVQGRTLLAHLRTLPPPPWSHATLDEVLEIFQKVCDAVAFAHSKGVVHRDLKPENIMVGSFGQVYVMDWGIAVRCQRGDDGRLHPIEAKKGLRGTLAYMAPEQARRGVAGVDERADVYGLGAVLYEFLTGRPPFEPRGVLEDVVRITRDHGKDDRLRWDLYNIPHHCSYLALSDDKGRIMVIATHNCDNGDGWEQEGVNEYYFKEFSEKWSYPLGINIVFYVMTH